MKRRAFKQVDVFTSVPLSGNALAVILDAEGISDADMQRIAAWTNLSETTFVLPPTKPGASYRVRIFTPRSELPFAGHPSVGTAHALIEAGRIDPAADLIQECAAGLLPVRVDGEGAGRRVFVRAPRVRAKHTQAADIDAFVRALGAPSAGPAAPQTLNAGPDWLIVDLGSEAAVRTLKPDLAAIDATSRRTGITGVSVFGRAQGSEYALVVRAFAPADGVPEDPVTGSANAAIGAYLLLTGQLNGLSRPSMASEALGLLPGAVGANYRASQGREVGRNGFVDVRVDATSGEVEIGGQSVSCVEGTLLL